MGADGGAERDEIGRDEIGRDEAGRTDGSAGVRPGVSAEQLSADPVEQFGRWFAEARAHPKIVLPEAACLSTLGPSQTPEGRMVLVRNFGPAGFVFYTNLGSNKAKSLSRHPKAGLTFFWEPMGRQARVRGRVKSVAPEEADAYYASRPRGSRIGAWASKQSRQLESRAALDARVQAAAERFAAGDVPRPPHWSGYLIVPDAIEFWQEGQSRLHDRFAYSLQRDGTWVRRRLYP